jgi:hypothetical protein
MGLADAMQGTGCLQVQRVLVLHLLLSLLLLLLLPLLLLLVVVKVQQLLALPAAGSHVVQ